MAIFQDDLGKSNSGCYWS